MEIKQQYLERYLHDIAINQLTADYQAKGYQVSQQEKIGNYHPDLVVKKDDEVIVVEVKAGKMTPQKRRQVVEIGDYVRGQKNYKFLVVVATPPKPKKIDIPNLNDLLYEYLLNNPSDELNRLSSRTLINNVSDAVTDEVIINEDGSIAAKGSGIVEVNLNYGPRNNDGASTHDSFPFTFEIILKYNKSQELVLDTAKSVLVDESSFYE